MSGAQTLRITDLDVNAKSSGRATRLTSPRRTVARAAAFMEIGVTTQKYPASPRVALLAAAAAIVVAAAAIAQDAASGVIDVSDKASIDANMEKDVVVQGVCALAEWSKSGKVMNITFEKTDETRLTVVAFSRTKDRLDAAFGGDATKAFTGATIRVRGKLRAYGGKAEAMKGRPEVTITDPAQVTVVTPAPAATQPTTQATD